MGAGCWMDNSLALTLGCGLSGVPWECVTSKIVGGCLVRPGELPWLCGLEVEGELRCGATVIQLSSSHSILLTAAHCLQAASSVLAILHYIYLSIRTSMFEISVNISFSPQLFPHWV